MRSLAVCGVAAVAALVVVMACPAVSRAYCGDPTDPVLGTVPVGGINPGVSYPHPLLERTAIMGGSFLNLIDFDMNKDPTPVFVGGSAEANPTIANLGTTETPEYAAFVARYDGAVVRVDIDAETREATRGWTTTLPGDCHFLTAAPVVHVRRYATAAFQAAYVNDVVYVATANACEDEVGNRIYALDAETGNVLWTFNELGSVDMDRVSESPVLDLQNDMLIVASDRRASPTQDSLWGIDVLTGTAAWSASVGKLTNAPVVRDDRIYVADQSGYIRALNREDGTVLWSNRASYYGFVSNVFVEFRVPYQDLIAAADRFGNVVLVTDDGNTGSKVWSSKLANNASGPVGIDPENGKLYVGDTKGSLHQLSILDGSVEASNVIDPSGASIGATSFTFSSSLFEEIVMVVGSSNGEYAKLCYPWAAPVAGAVPGISSLAPEMCGDASDCGEPPNKCATWECVGKVCVPAPLPDGGRCEAPKGEGVCSAGVCSPKSTCDTEEALYACNCTNDEGFAIERYLLVREEQLKEKPPEGDPPGNADPIQTPVSAVATTTSCLTIGSDVRSAVFVHLIDQHGRPFKGVDVTFTLEGSDGTLPVWLEARESKEKSALAFEAQRPGTYYAILGAPPEGSEASGSEGIRISVQANGCFPEHLPIQTTIITAKPRAQDGAGCTLLSDKGTSGYLEVLVTLRGERVEGAQVVVGHAKIENAFYSSYQRFIDSEKPGEPPQPPDLPNVQETGADGRVVFRDYGNKLNGPTVVKVGYPGFNITVPDVDTSQLHVELTNPPKEEQDPEKP